MEEVLNIMITGILRGGMYALMAVGLSLVFGVMNIPNFAHGEFYMLGAYFAFFAFSVVQNPVAAIVIAAVLAFAAGGIIEKIFFYPLRKRNRGQWVMNTFLVTLGVSIIIKNSAQLIWGTTYKGITQYWEGGVNFFSIINISYDRLAGFCIAVAVITLFWIFLSQTKLGRAIRAVSQDEVGAGMVGINLDGIHTFTFALSCMLAAMAGGILLSVTPAYPLMGMQPLYKSWFVLILVGMGNVGGSIFGGLIVGILETIGYMKLGAGWQDVFSLMLIIIILLVKPRGLFAKKGVKSVVE